MKKLLSLVLTVVLVGCLTACLPTGEPFETERMSQAPSESVCAHNWQAATCTDPKTCSKCGKTQGTALGHTTSTGICSRCGVSFCAWEMGEFVDEFKQPTGEKYIATDVYGTFSNSATSNSRLLACVQVTSDSIAFMLWEYGSQLVKGTFDLNEYSITVLDQNGRKHYLDGYMYEDSTRIFVSSSDESELLALLKKPGELSFYLKYSKYTSSTYLFTIETAGFSSLYSEID